MIERAQAIAAEKAAHSAARAQGLAGATLGQGQGGIVTLLAAQAHTPQEATRLLEQLDAARPRLLAVASGNVSGIADGGVKRQCRLDGLSGEDHEGGMVDVNSTDSSYA